MDRENPSPHFLLFSLYYSYVVDVCNRLFT
jgi:hypothetical protein